MSCKCSTSGEPCNGCLCCTPIGVTNLTTCFPPDPCEGNYYDICCIDPPPIPCLTVDPDKNFCEILVDILDELTGRCNCACVCYKVTNLSQSVWRRNYFTCNLDGTNTLVEAVVDVNQEKYFYGCINLKPTNIPDGVTIEEIESDNCRELANCETCSIYTITNNTNTDWTRISTGCDGDGNYTQTSTIKAGETLEVCACADILPVVPVPGIIIVVGDEACDSPLCDFEVIVNVSTTTTSTTSTTSTSTTTTTTLPCYCLEVFGRDGDILQVKNCDGSQIELPFVGTPSTTSPYIGILSMVRCAYDIAVDGQPFIYSHGKCVPGTPCVPTTTTTSTTSSSTTTTTTSSCSFDAEIEVVYPTTTTTTFTTTTSTTTTTTQACNCYKVLNPGNSLESVTWVGCNPDLPGFGLTNVEELSPGEIKFICSTYNNVELTQGLFVNPQGICTTGCVPPTSYCYEVGATGGDINIRFVDYNSIITTMMIADGTTEIICAWEDSIEQYAGTGTIVTPIQGASCISSCVTTTTTISCHCHTIDAGDAVDYVVNYTDCSGSNVTLVSTALDPIKSPYSFCARMGSVQTDLSTMVITIGDTCNSDNDCLNCNCFTIQTISKSSEYQYIDCEGNIVSGFVELFAPMQVCGYFDTIVFYVNTLYTLDTTKNCTLVGNTYECDPTPTTTTSTTTTTTEPPCNCYYIEVPRGATTSLTYLGCDGQTGSVAVGSFGMYCIREVIDLGDGVAYFTGNLCEIPVGNTGFKCPTVDCQCYTLEVPLNGVNPLLFIDCNYKLQTINPGEFGEYCLRYVITEGDGSATFSGNECIAGDVRSGPIPYSCPLPPPRPPDAEICTTCTPSLSGVTQDLISTLNIGTLTVGGSCILTNYAIEWYLNDLSGPLQFVSGNVGNTDPAITQTHPFVRPSQSGVWIPIIRYATIGGMKYYSTDIAGELYSPDLFDCLIGVSVSAFTCSNGNPVGDYSHQITFNQTVNLADIDRSINFELTGTENYFAYSFDALTITDTLTLTYVSTAGNTVLQTITAGGFNSNFNLTPKLQSAVVKDVIDLTFLTYLPGDYIKIEVVGNPINVSTIWTFKCKCLETFNCNWDRPQLRYCNQSLTYDPVNCSLIGSVYVDNYTGSFHNSDKDIYKYLLSSANVGTLNAGASTIITGDAPTNSLITITRNFGSFCNYTGTNVVGCNLNTSSINVTKSGANITITCNNLTDYNAYKSAIISAEAVLAGGFINDNTNINYYRNFEFRFRVAPTCGEPSSLNVITTHYTSYSTFVFDDVNFIITFTIQNVTNNLGITCSTCASLSSISAVATSLALPNSSINYLTRYNNPVVSRVSTIQLQQPTLMDITNVSTRFIYSIPPTICPDDSFSCVETLANNVTQQKWYNYRYQFVITDVNDPINNYELRDYVNYTTGCLETTAYTLVYKIVAGVVINNSCTTTTTTTIPTYTVGQSALGGIIAYILQPGDPGYDPAVQHGFVATVNDLPGGNNYAWGCGLYTAVNGTALGTGSQNTIDIVSVCSGINAAPSCSDLVEGGYNDWYLPSLDELLKLYDNRALIGGFDTTSAYWSSSSNGSVQAWHVWFVSGLPQLEMKFYAQRVRPIRSF